MKASSPLVWVALGAVLGACAEEPPPPPPVQTAVTTEAAGAVEATPTQQGPDTAAARRETELVREVFSYRGSGRDPFISLLRSGDVRPLLEDLRVTSISFNERYPSSSIAVLRDTTVNQRYTVRVGDEIGRLRIAEIRATEVVVILEEFGVERQQTLRMRRRQEGTE